MVPEIWCVTDVIVISHFGLFFACLSPKQSKTSKFWKNEKKHVEISSFYICVPKIMIRSCIVPEIHCATDGRTDERKEWDIEVGTPPKNTQGFFCLVQKSKVPWYGQFSHHIHTDGTNSFLHVDSNSRELKVTSVIFGWVCPLLHWFERCPTLQLWLVNPGGPL